MLLREELLDTCSASGAGVNEVAQALVDALMITLIVVGPDVDAAELNLHRICDDMRANIRQSFAEWYAMAEARRVPRQ
jgi:hypothetical protein